MQFRLRTLLIVFVTMSLALAWWLDHRRLSSHLRMREQQIGQLQKQVASKTGQYFFPANIRFKTPEELVAFIKEGDDREFEQEEWSGWIGSHLSDEAVPDLVELASHPNEATRRHATILLGWVGLKKRPPKVDPIPALIVALDDSSSRVRGESAGALGNYGALAKSALPRLREIMQRDNSFNAFMATKTLKKIDPTEDIGPRLRELFLADEKGVRVNVSFDLPDHLPAAEAKQLLMAQYERETSKEMQAVLALAMNKIKE